MRPLRTLLTVLTAALVALALVAGPVAASVGEVPAAAETEAPEETGGQESGRRTVADTPRDRVGLILLGLLAAAGILGFANARRQLKGDRPQASGEFRWR